jgi:hypothetical protein
MAILCNLPSCMVKCLHTHDASKFDGKGVALSKCLQMACKSRRLSCSGLRGLAVAVGSDSVAEYAASGERDK